MLCLTLEPADLHGFTSLGDYQFVDQGVLYLYLLPPSLYPIFSE
jgi:hypothetical protein